MQGMSKTKTKCFLKNCHLLLTDKEAAERLSKTVDEACLLLAEYNGRLAAELEDRRQLARMLVEYTQNQKDVLTEKEKKLEVSIAQLLKAVLPPKMFIPLLFTLIKGLCVIYTIVFEAPAAERSPCFPAPHGFVIQLLKLC